MTAATRYLGLFSLLTPGSGPGSGAATYLGAATGETHSYPGWLKVLIWITVGLILLGGYVLACAFWPWAPCRKCKGEGRFKSPSGKAWRHCPRCHGGRERLRFGRKVYNFYAKGAKHVH